MAAAFSLAKRDLSRALGGDNFEGLAPVVIRREADLSRAALRAERLDVLYGHGDDRSRPVAETTSVFSSPPSSGVIGVPGLSNIATWRLAELRAAAPVGVVQNQGIYGYPCPYDRAGTWVHQIDPELRDYASTQDSLTLVAYGPLMAGGDTRPDKLDPLYDHPSNHRRIGAATTAAADLGVTASQVVPAWLMGGPTPVIPLFGTSSVPQLEESMAAADLNLPPELRDRLDGA